MRLFLRATAIRVRLTAVRRSDDIDTGSIYLDPRLCWAMELQEFERIEVCNPTRCLRIPVHVRYGGPGDAVLTQAAGHLMQPGDQIKLSAVTWHPADETHAALLVLAGEGNVPLEIRHVFARTADLDPVSFPPPPVLEYVSLPRHTPPIEAMD